MKQKLKKIIEALLNALNELDELIEKENGEKDVVKARPIDPPPPDKPKG